MNLLNGNKSHIKILSLGGDVFFELDILYC